ncbi:MAG: hypothetical protein JKY96_00210 [Phycisphaerales bacterium]|nr:hypothetical protein [Phycisphaerales bacterium]
MNPYGYVGLSPYVWRDPLGEERIIIIMEGLNSHLAEDAWREYMKDFGTVEVFEQDQVNEAVEYAKEKAAESNEDGEGNTIIILGYSNGGRAAVEAAKQLGKECVQVDLVVTVDPVPKWNEAPWSLFFPGLANPRLLYVPGNVGRWVNYYQRDDVIIRGNKVKGAENNRIRKERSDAHTRMPYRRDVNDAISDAVEGVPEQRESNGGCCE